jgi:hypothetical protein
VGDQEEQVQVYQQLLVQMVNRQVLLDITLVVAEEEYGQIFQPHKQQVLMVKEV